MAVINTIAGIIGIKSNHENIITQLDKGFITIFNVENIEIKKISVRSGTLKFINNENLCVISIID